MRNALKILVVFLLTLEARALLARARPRIVAITGSVGKTTTKDAVYAALAGHLSVRKSQKSFNSEFGVPLTVLGLDNAWDSPFGWFLNLAQGFWTALYPKRYPEWLVLEVGADRPGDIRSIARWLKPHVVVLTGIPDVPVHVEFFASPEELAREKGLLVEALRYGGLLVVNGDDERSERIHRAYRGDSVAYGFAGECSFSASHEGVTYDEKSGFPTGIFFRANHAGSSVPVHINGSLGKPKIYAALAALAVAEYAGVDAVSASDALSRWTPTPGRMRLIPGLKDSLIIDDTYNSSPAAALSALDTLKEVQGAKRRIAILGDMLELGKFSAEAHRQVGEYAAKRVTLLATVGFRARAIAQAALSAGLREEKIRQYEQNEAQRVGKEIELELKKGDIVLVKGSQSMRLERAVEELMAEPEKARELLVRQDEEWKRR